MKPAALWRFKHSFVSLAVYVRYCGLAWKYWKRLVPSAEGGNTLINPVGFSAQAGKIVALANVGDRDSGGSYAVCML
jgi:hypothetical protein